MADETISTIESEEAIASTKATEPKKQRAPRQKKAAAEVAAPAPAAIVKSPRVPRKKRSEKPAETAPALEKVTDDSKVGKVRRGVGRPKQMAQTTKAAPAQPAAADEMADLIQLEEENKSLRKALSEKLRAENADLRKRLG